MPQEAKAPQSKPFQLVYVQLSPYSLVSPQPYEITAWASPLNSA